MEGDYEWTKAEKEFKSLDEINKVLIKQGIVCGLLPIPHANGVFFKMSLFWTENLTH